MAYGDETCGGPAGRGRVLRSGLLELDGTKRQVDSRADYSLGLWQLVLPGVLHWAAHHQNVAVVQLDGHRL